MSEETTPRACASRWPLIVALLALLISVVFGFGLTQNVSGLRQEIAKVAELSDVRAEMEGLRTEMGALQKRLDGIDDLENVARRAVISASLVDLSQRLGVLAGTVENDDHARKLNEAMRLMQEIQADLDGKK